MAFRRLAAEFRVIGLNTNFVIWNTTSSAGPNQTGDVTWTYDPTVVEHRFFVNNNVLSSAVHPTYGDKRYTGVPNYANEFHALGSMNWQNQNTNVCPYRISRFYAFNVDKSIGLDL